MDGIIIISVSIMAGLATYLLAGKFRKGAVMSSSMVVLASGIILPLIFPTMGNTLAVVAACGSYGGMVSRKNAPSALDATMISALAGLLFIMTLPAYAGIGGRLGTIAAIAYFTWTGMKKSSQKMNSLIEVEPYQRMCGVWDH